MESPTHQAVRSDQKRRLQPSCILNLTKGSFEFTEYFGTSPGQFFLLWWVAKYFKHPTESSESKEGGRFLLHLAFWSLRRRHPVGREEGQVLVPRLLAPRTSAWPLSRGLHPHSTLCYSTIHFRGRHWKWNITLHTHQSFFLIPLSTPQKSFKVVFPYGSLPKTLWSTSPHFRFIRMSCTVLYFMYNYLSSQTTCPVADVCKSLYFP